jgi:hypothetical protein
MKGIAMHYYIKPMSRYDLLASRIEAIVTYWVYIRGQKLTYEKLVELLEKYTGLKYRPYNMYISRALGSMVAKDMKKGVPLRACCVVSVSNNLPSEGFFKCLKRLGEDIPEADQAIFCQNIYTMLGV